VLFSEPKIPQSTPVISPDKTSDGFSALQRAENSSMKALAVISNNVPGFSALQRAENSSICVIVGGTACTNPVSVLFSEPKIPQ